MLHYSAPPIVGGVETVIAEHARLLAAAGYPTSLIVGRGGASGLTENVSVRVVPEMDSEYPINQTMTTALNRGEVPHEFEGLCRDLEMALENALAGVDVIVAHNVLTMHFNLPLVAVLHRLMDRRVGRQWIAWAHDVSRYVNPASGTPQRRGFPWDLLRAYRPEATYVAVSSHRKRLLAEVLQCPLEAIQVVPNGVEVADSLGLSDIGQHLAEEFDLLLADLVILMPVRITRAKNIEYALRVAAALKAAKLSLRLIVTGPPDPHSADITAYCAELDTLRHNLHLEKEVAFIYEGTSTLGRPLWLSPTVVGELYRLADLVLMPSHREGFGMPILEAGMVGRPVFATAMPALEEIGVGLVSQIASVEPPEQVAARIQGWSAQDMTHRLRRRVRQAYTWSAILSRYLVPLINQAMLSPVGDAT